MFLSVISFTDYAVSTQPEKNITISQVLLLI